MQYRQIQSRICSHWLSHQLTEPTLRFEINVSHRHRVRISLQLVSIMPLLDMDQKFFFLHPQRLPSIRTFCTLQLRHQFSRIDMRLGVITSHSISMGIILILDSYDTDMGPQSPDQ